jgi:16S rRNA (cytidine1402-2'-O)-methyltransferase
MIRKIISRSEFNLLLAIIAHMSGKLILVPTPIGNLEDITLRAIRVLKECDAVLAEDTRETGKLLKHFEIQKPLLSYHMHNEHRELDKFVNRLQQGQTLALVSDAGTPAISDPGFLLVRECLRNEIYVECLPGPTAFVPALVKSGLPCNQFLFYGFLPDKKGRQTALQYLTALPHTFVLYEAPHRILKTLTQLAEHAGPDRPVSVSRELTKFFEETFNGTLADAITHFTAKPPKGEFVMVVGGI